MDKNSDAKFFKRIVRIPLGNILIAVIEVPFCFVPQSANIKKQVFYTHFCSHDRFYTGRTYIVVVVKNWLSIFIGSSCLSGLRQPRRDLQCIVQSKHVFPKYNHKYSFTYSVFVSYTHCQINSFVGLFFLLVVQFT